MLRVIIAMTIASASAAIGLIMLRLGMKQVGSLENYAPWPLMIYFWHVVCNPYIIFGTVLNLVFYLLYLATLSWTGVTVALPMTVIEQIFAIALAVAILKEQVPTARWIGIILVIVGIIFIARGGGEI